MKIFCIFLICFFTLGQFDFPAVSAQNMKPGSCCCSSASLCRCRHAGGMCPMKKMEQSRETAGMKPGCPMHAKKPLNETAAAQVKQTPENPLLPFLKAMGCGSTEEHKTAPGYSRDFMFDSLPLNLPVLKADYFNVPDVNPPLPFLFYGLEKPPQNALSL